MHEAGGVEGDLVVVKISLYEILPLENRLDAWLHRERGRSKSFADVAIYVDVHVILPRQAEVQQFSRSALVLYQHARVVYLGHSSRRPHPDAQR